MALYCWIRTSKNAISLLHYLQFHVMQRKWIGCEAFTSWAMTCNCQSPIHVTKHRSWTVQTTSFPINLQWEWKLQTWVPWNERHFIILGRKSKMCSPTFNMFQLALFLLCFKTFDGELFNLHTRQVKDSMHLLI